MLIEDVFTLKAGDQIISRKRSGTVVQIDTGATEYKIKIGDLATVKRFGIDDRLNPFVEIVLDRMPGTVIQQRPRQISACFV